MEQRQLEEHYLCELPLRKSQDVYREMRDIKAWDKEVFVAFFLDSVSRIISREIVSIGTLNQVLIHPRDVFRTAIARNANAVVVAHNHPSGECLPSAEDARITKRLAEAGELLGIKLLDHVIVGSKGYYSFKDDDEL